MSTPLAVRHTLTTRGPGSASLRRGRRWVPVAAWFYPKSGRLFIDHPDLGWIDAANGAPAVWRDGQPFVVTIIHGGPTWTALFNSPFTLKAADA